MRAIISSLFWILLLGAWLFILYVLIGSFAHG